MGATVTPHAPRSTSGILVIDKPVGPTSFEVVARIKRILHADKVGHTGTLDPLASGVLVVCLGEAVKLQHYLTEGDKAYEAQVAFGAATTTQDAEGEITQRGDPSVLDAERVREALPAFLGEIDQLPPMFSAVRVAGRRLHEAARAGEEVARAARKVRIDAFELLEWWPATDGMARARLAVRCGKGTYVRTLAADLGSALGVPAHLAGLRRIASGPFGIDETMTFQEFERLAGEGAVAERVLPLSEALRGWPRVQLTAGQARDLRHGQALPIPDLAEGRCGALDAEGHLLAVCEGRGGLLQPMRVLCAIR